VPPPVADRDRTDVDIEFDFFDEPPPAAASSEETGSSKGGGPPLRPRSPSDRRVSLPRLALLIAGALVLAVVLIFWVNSCREGQKKGSYQDYMESVGAVATRAEAVGGKMVEVLTTPGISLDELATRMSALAQEQAQVVNQADALTPPGPLVQEQESLVESMQFLESGLSGLGQAFGEIQFADDPDTAGATLASQSGRLIAGSVVYDDLFRARSQEVMREEGISGVPVPELRFFESADLVSQGSLAELVARATQGGGAGGGTGGLHGNQIDAVTALPEQIRLSPDEETTIVLTDALAFEVAVTNSGDFQETRVQVTLTIQQSPEPISKSQTIPIINKGQTETVTFTDFNIQQVAASLNLKVAVKPVEGETNTDNNTVDYPVIFSLE
jgi:hypothetical protein